jgi:hypothetical protein
MNRQKTIMKKMTLAEKRQTEANSKIKVVQADDL